MNPWLVLLALTVLAVLFVAVPLAAASLSYWRRPCQVRCPRADLEARISVNAGRATLGEVLGRPDLKVSRCSLWRMLPRLRSCRQECLEQAGLAPSEERGVS